MDKNGVMVLNKPEKMSSFLAVKLVQKAVNAKKAGHMGTLDPLATGVLVIGINRGTKLFDKFLKGNKEYIAEYTFGYETDTLDSEGEIIKQDNKIITQEQIESVLQSFVGKYEQMPPLYSAKKINGKRACDLIREGVEVKLNPKEIEVFDLKFIEEVKQNTFKIKIKCSSGFYVRSLGRDIAEKLGTYCTTTKIHRTMCCGYDITQSNTIEEIKEGKYNFFEIEI